MKTMTCNQLAGSCDQTFSADTFEEIAEMSKAHAMEMAAKGDQPHLDKMQEMKTLMMNNPEAAQKWFADKMAEFNAIDEE